MGTAAVATSADSPGSRWLVFLSSQLHESATVDVDSVADDLRDGTLAPDALTLFTHWMSVTRVQWSYGKSWPSPVAAHDAERDALVATWLAHGIVGDPPDIRGLFDEDFDEVPTLTDNCWAIANLDQLDSDGDGEGDACDLTPNDECPSGQWPVVDPATGASYCVTRCLDSGYPACPADMDCAGDSPRNPGTFRPSFADYGGFFSFCVRSCDLHAADPCPEGYSCHRYTTPVAPTGVPPGDRHTHCLPFAYGMNHTSCSGWDGFRPWCLDGYLCPNGGRGEACREVCDPADAGSCPSGTCTPIVTAGPAPYGLCPAM